MQAASRIRTAGAALGITAVVLVAANVAIVRSATRPHPPDLRSAHDVAVAFVSTAVRRVRVERSWPLVAPWLRRGYTRETWARGKIPVVPFPAVAASWRLVAHARRVVAYLVRLYAPPSHPEYGGSFVFRLVLVVLGGRWLVSSWTPAVVPAAPAGAA